MNKKDIKTLYNIFQEKINFNNSSGIINELKITEQSIYAYGIFLGYNGWFKLNNQTFKWESINIQK